MQATRNPCGLRTAHAAIAAFAGLVLAPPSTGAADRAADQPGFEKLVDKTLVVWAAPADLAQRGGSALTIDDTRSHFDGIVFGELSPRKWMPGSDFFRRTAKRQNDWMAETATAPRALTVSAWRSSPPAARPSFRPSRPGISCRPIRTKRSRPTRASRSIPKRLSGNSACLGICFWGEGL